ncbi:MAG: ATP-binding protein [Acidimicrobiales bacterium]
MGPVVRTGGELRHWLKSWRHQRRMSQAALAEALGYDVTYVAKIEGGTRPPSRQFLARLAQVADAPEEALVHAVTSDLVRTPLPCAADALVGRRREIDELVALLSGRARIVTLLGPPGIGKTRLAMEVAVRLDRVDLNGAWWVSLLDVPDAGGVVHRVNRELGVANRAGEDPVQRLVDRLRGHQALLVLDNFEHVIEARSLVGRLATSVPGVSILVTSREELGVNGEHLYRVPALPLPTLCTVATPAAGEEGSGTAVELFAVRARMADPKFQLTSMNCVAIARTCTSLDGIPLAIILAAGALTTEGPQGLERLAADPLELPEGGLDDRSPHHRTLSSAIAGSWALLPADEASFLNRLAVFAGGCDAEAAAAVAGPISERGSDRRGTMRLLSALTSKSLLEVVPDVRDVPRFHLLASVRSFAAYRLAESGGKDEVRRDHLRHFAGVAVRCGAGLIREEQPECLRLLALELDNLAVAFEFALVDDPERALALAASCWRFFLVRDIPTGRRWLERALAAAPAPVRARGDALAAAGALAWVTGHFSQSREHLDGAHAVAEALDLPDLRALVLLNRGALAEQLSDLDEADACFVEAFDLYDRIADDRGRAGAIVGRGMVCRRRADLASASGHWVEAARLFRSVGDRFNQTMALGNLAWAAEHEAQYEEAQEWLIESRCIQIALGDARGLATTTSGLARVAQKRGALADAERLAFEALTAYHHLGDRPWVAATLVLLASILSGPGRERQALRLIGCADALWDAMGAPPHSEDAERRAEVVDRCRRRLGDGEFSRALGAGRSMTASDAIEFARQNAGGGRDVVPAASSVDTR